MARFVLVSDATLLSNYRDFPLLDFLPCAPTDYVPKSVYYFLKGKDKRMFPNGEAVVAPYSIRKLEASLLTRFKREEVAVPHNSTIESFIDDETELIAVSTMDPLGFGPLTMSYYVLLGGTGAPWVRREWETLIARINAARKGKKAKLIIGGPGVWEFTIMPEELDKEGIDFAFQGESEDLLCDLFEGLPHDALDQNKFLYAYKTVDDSFHWFYKDHPKFICRKPGTRSSVPLNEIPNIVRPAVKGMVETMRGCGIGCDFCEVTLRPLRYYPYEKIGMEIEVNTKLSGTHKAWLHSDEFFGYMHTKANFEPNQEALIELMKYVMGMPGITQSNPTHGRVSIAAGFPDLIKKLSEIMKAGPNNWIGIQTGVETGSERLAAKHMPNKTLPLKIGPDGSWQDIVWKGTQEFTRYFWRPAYTVQVGQREETPEDNWETVALINRMSNSFVDGRPFEFTATPMQNVPLGKIKSNSFHAIELDESQLAVYYASYRHLAKMAIRDARKNGRANPLAKAGMTGILSVGGWGMMKMVEQICKKRGLNIDKAKRWGLEQSVATMQVRN